MDLKIETLVLEICFLTTQLKNSTLGCRTGANPRGESPPSH